MDEVALRVLRDGGFVAAVLLALALERLVPHARLRGSWITNGSLALANAVIMAAVCGACGFATAAWAARERWGVLNQLGSGTAVALPATLVILDLVSYGWHRANHAVGVLWRLHQVHHCDPTFTVSTALRFHPGELLLALPVRLAAIVALGASVEAVLVFELAFTVANLIEHGDIRLAPRLERALGRALVTPALHRWHHAKSRDDRNTNFGTIFTLWDRVCGTYAANDSATRVDTGLPAVSSLTPLQALLLPFRGAV